MHEMMDQLAELSIIDENGREVIQAYRNEKFEAPLSDLEKHTEPAAIRQAYKELVELTDLLERYLPDYIGKTAP